MDLTENNSRSNLADYRRMQELGLGSIALKNGLLDEAGIAFRVACRLDGNCSEAYSGLALVAQKKTDYKQAFEMYLTALKLDTDNLTALLGLFQTSCRMGSFARVIHYLRIYLEKHPGDTFVMFSLAALYIKDKKLAQARDILRKLLLLDPTNDDAEKLLEEVEHDLAKKDAEYAHEKAGLPGG